MDSITPIAGTTPPQGPKKDIIEAIGTIRDHRVAALNEYKEKSGPFRGLSSFGGPRDSFRKDVLSMQRVKEIVNARMCKLGLGGALFGSAAGIAFFAAGTTVLILAGITPLVVGFAAALAATTAVSFGTVLLPFIGTGIAIGGAEGIGRLVNKWLAGKEQEKIKNLAEIKDEAALVKHWKELKQGDRNYLLGKMALNDPGFETGYAALENEPKALNAKDIEYFNGATFIKNTTAHTLTEEETKQFYYFRKQSISSDFLEKKDFKVLLSLHEADPDSTPIKIALYRNIIKASSPDRKRVLLADLPISAADQLFKLPEGSRKDLFNNLLSSIAHDSTLEKDLPHFFNIVPFLTRNLYKDTALEKSSSLLKKAEDALYKPVDSLEVKLAKIKEIIPQIQEAIKD